MSDWLRIYFIYSPDSPVLVRLHSLITMFYSNSVFPEKQKYNNKLNASLAFMALQLNSSHKRYMLIIY